MVAEQFVNRFADWLAENTDFEDWHIGVRSSVRSQAIQMVEAAVAEELERCAKIVEARGDAERACAETVAQFSVGPNDAMLYAARSLYQTALTIRRANL